MKQGVLYPGWSFLILPMISRALTSEGEIPVLAEKKKPLSPGRLQEIIKEDLS